MSARLLGRPVWILYVFIVGLALHNLVMSSLYAAGLRGAGLEVVSAWKEALLALGLLLVLRAHGVRRFQPIALDWLALAYAALVVVYGLIPQHLLGGVATHTGILYGEREDLLPVACYLFGRGLAISRRDAAGLLATLLATGCALALFGLVDIWTIPFSWWQTSSGAAGWFRHQLGFEYGQATGSLPQNFVYNAGHNHFYRRLVSSFLSPLASADLLLVALLACVGWALARRPSRWLWLPVLALLSAGLLWTHSRADDVALVLGFALLAWRERRWRRQLVAATAASAVVCLAFLAAYRQVAPSANLTTSEIALQEANAHVARTGPGDTAEHVSSLRGGIDQVLSHPQGFGPGNAGSNAARTNVALKAGESTYTEIGVDAGLAGALLFIAWSLALLWRLLSAGPWLAAALLGVLVLGLQTDVLGVPWLVYVLWILFGWRVSPGRTGPAEPGHASCDAPAGLRAAPA